MPTVATVYYCSEMANMQKQLRKETVFTMLCNVYKRSSLQPFYNQPCASDMLDIYYVVNHANSTVSAEVLYSDIDRKALKLPGGNGFVLMQMLHDE